MTKNKVTNEEANLEVEDLKSQIDKSSENVSQENTESKEEDIENNEATDQEKIVDIKSEDVEQEKLQQELAKWRDLAHRSQAELDNFRKRISKEKSENLKYSNYSLLSGLVPIIDNFNFGLQAVNENDSEDNIKNVVLGMDMVKKQLFDFLSEQNVTEINAIGEKFDHNLHHAIKQEASEDIEENFVIYQIRKGYKLYDRLIRPAEVVVSAGKNKDEESNLEDENNDTTQDNS